MTFPDAITRAMPPDDRLRIGIIASVAPVTVSVQGSALPGHAIGSYAPMLGDNVAVLRQDQTWLILGKTTSAESTDPGPVLQAGEVVMTVTAATGATANVVFARPFTRIPAVATNLASGAGPTNGWVSRAFAITTTGFTMFIFGASSTFTTAVQWQAQEYTQ